jgi:hypothetical protein
MKGLTTSSRKGLPPVLEELAETLSMSGRVEGERVSRPSDSRSSDLEG